MHSFLILGHTMAEVARELDAIKTNEVLAAVVAEQPNPLGTSLTAVAVGLLSAGGEPRSPTLPGEHPDRAGGPTNLPAQATAAASSANAASRVAASRGRPVTYVEPPSGLRISGVLRRDDGTAYVLCNGRIVRVGGYATVVSGGTEIRLKLEAIEGSTPRWSLVPAVSAEDVITLGGQ
jgi:hypothetical protein